MLRSIRGAGSLVTPGENLTKGQFSASCSLPNAVILPIVEAPEANRILFSNIVSDADASLGYICKLRAGKKASPPVRGAIVDSTFGFPSWSSSLKIPIGFNVSFNVLSI